MAGGRSKASHFIEVELSWDVEQGPAAGVQSMRAMILLVLPMLCVLPIRFVGRCLLPSSWQEALRL